MPRPSVSAGELNRRVSIHTIVETADSFGQAVQTLSDAIATVWCRVKTLSGGERTQGAQVAGLHTHEIQTRYSPTLLPVGSKMAMVLNGRRLNVDSVVDTDDAHVELIWRCVEIRN